MLAVLSPAKTLDFDTVAKTRKRSEPRFVARADELATHMQSFSPADLSDLMGVSTKLGELNADRFDNWGRDSAPQKQAILAFKGDVYMGLEAWTFGARELTSAQRRLRILSGLYGMLRPLDMIHPYRLEMGTPFANNRGFSVNPILYEPHFPSSSTRIREHGWRGC